MKAAPRYGLINAGAGIGISLLIFGLGLEKEKSVQIITMIVSLGLYVYFIYKGIKTKKDEENSGFLSFGSGFSAGLIIASVSSIILALYQYLYVTVINKGWITYLRMRQEQELLNRGWSEERIARSSEFLELNTSPLVSTISFIVIWIIIGLIISLIVAAVLKKEDPAEMP